MLSILAMATAGGSAIGLVAAAAKASKTTIGYAAASGTIAGAGAGFYYQEDIHEGMSRLFTKPNNPIEPSLTELAIELKQPVACANAMHETRLEQHDNLLSQSIKQQKALDVSLMELGHVANQTTRLTIELTHAVPALHSLGDEMMLDVQTMHHTTIERCKQAEQLHDELCHTKDRLKEEEQRFVALVDDLTKTENTFAQSRDVEQQLHRLVDLKQQIDNAHSRDELLIENTRLKQQIRDLQAMATDAHALLLELSNENGALKKITHPHEPQRTTPSLTLFSR